MTYNKESGLYQGKHYLNSVCASPGYRFYFFFTYYCCITITMDSTVTNFSCNRNKIMFIRSNMREYNNNTIYSI